MANNGATIRASWIEPREYVPPNVYNKRTVESMSDRELRNNVCIGVAGGCEKCEVLPSCRYGAEWLKRKERKK